MNRMQGLTARRRETRFERASAAVARILDDAGKDGFEITVIGSLAKGDFRAHSDVDLLVRGPSDLHRRRSIERLVADQMRACEIPYDLVFEDDLTEDRLRELLHDIV
ncbi:putative nucleotidyltransferase [Rhizobium aquaticum]|uniref:Nucleotidyltransferase n=1 Tax=Rhizobium aquaticum TaxID=1549636 RepID=A0ABV2J3Q7_9HYPH